MRKLPNKGKAMSHLHIRNLDAKTLNLLRVRAAKHGVSIEEEVRRIAHDAVMPPQKIGSLAISHFGCERIFPKTN